MLESWHVLNGLWNIRYLCSLLSIQAVGRGHFFSSNTTCSETNLFFSFTQTIKTLNTAFNRFNLVCGLSHLLKHNYRRRQERRVSTSQHELEFFFMMILMNPAALCTGSFLRCIVLFSILFFFHTVSCLTDEQILIGVDEVEIQNYATTLIC